MCKKHITFLVLLLVMNHELLVSSRALLHSQSGLSDSPQFLYEHTKSKPEIKGEFLQKTDTSQVEISVETATTLASQSGNAIYAVKTFVEGAREAITSGRAATLLKNAFSVLSAASGYFMGLGAALSIISVFIPQQDDLSVMLNRVERLESTIVNSINAAVSNIKVAVQRESLRSAENRVRSATRWLQDMNNYKNDTSDFENAKELFKDDAEHSKDDIDTLMGAFIGTFLGDDSLFDSIIETAAGDWTKVGPTVLAFGELLAQAHWNYAAYINETNSSKWGKYQLYHKRNFDDIGNYTAKLPRKCFDHFKNKSLSLLNDAIKNTCDNNWGKAANERCAPAVLNYFQTKYPTYLRFTVVATIKINLDDPNEKGRLVYNGYNYVISRGQDNNMDKHVFLFYQLANGCHGVNADLNALYYRLYYYSRNGISKDTVPQMLLPLSGGVGVYQQLYAAKDWIDYGFASNYVPVNRLILQPETLDAYNPYTQTIMNRPYPLQGNTWMEFMGWIAVQDSGTDTCYV